MSFFGSFFNFGGGGSRGYTGFGYQGGRYYPAYSRDRGVFINQGYQDGVYYPPVLGHGFGHGGRNILSAALNVLSGGYRVGHYPHYTRGGYRGGVWTEPYGRRFHDSSEVYEKDEQGNLDRDGAYIVNHDGSREPAYPTSGRGRMYSQPYYDNAYNHNPRVAPAQPQSRPFADNTDPEIQNLTDRLQDVIAAGNDTEKLKKAAQAYVQAAQVFGGRDGDLHVPPQGVKVPAHDGYKGFVVFGKDRLPSDRPHNSPQYLAEFVLIKGNNNRQAAQAVVEAFSAQSKAPAQANGQPLDIRPNAPQAPTSGAVDLQKLEELLDAKFPEEKIGEIKELQTKLAMNGYGKAQGFSPVDGEIGPLTTAGFAQFAHSKGLDPMHVDQVVQALNQATQIPNINNGKNITSDLMPNTNIARYNLNKNSNVEVG